MKGEAVFALGVSGSRVMLTPSTGYSIQGDADPATWWYRLNLPGPTNTRFRILPADAVVHIRIGASPERPWLGRGPLQRAVADAKLAPAVVKALEAEARIPVGRLAWNAGSPDKAKHYAGNIARGGVIVQTPERPTVDPGAGFEGGSRWKPEVLGPQPDQTTAALRNDVGRDLFSAFGLSPALFAARGDGGGQREAWRRAWAGTFAPVARIIEAELRDKLDLRALTIRLSELRASDVQGRARAAAALMKAEVPQDQALRLAGLD